MDMMIDSSLGSLPTLIVPDDPVNGAIEKPKTPPPVEIDLSRMPPAVVNYKAAAVQEPVNEAALTPESGSSDTSSEQANPPNSSSPSGPNPATSPKVTPRGPDAKVETEPAVGTTQSPPHSARGTPRVKSNGDAFEIAFGESEQDQSVNTNNENGSSPQAVSPMVPTVSASPRANDNATAKLDQAESLDSITAAMATPAATSPLPPRPSTAPLLSSKDYSAMAKRAQALAKLDRLAAGSKSVFDADMQDIGALGIGMQLYFMLTKYLSLAFLVMGVIALPTITVNYYGNGVTDKLVDPLQLAYASLGNQGVNEDFASDPRMCLPKGYIDCSWTTVDTPFTSDPHTVSWIITVSDCLYSVCFLVFYLVFRYRASKAIELHMTENLTPGKYAVYVRGLPPDTQKQEILDHFNALYDLTKDDEYFPLWLSCCWGRRRKVAKALNKIRGIKNVGVVKNLDHLAGTSSTNKQMYLDTWIAEVSIGHPTGGLLRTFLSMEALTKGIAETQELITILELEKQNAVPGNKKLAFKPADEKLLQDAKKKLELLNADLEKKTGKIKAFKHAGDHGASTSSPNKRASVSNKVEPEGPSTTTTTTSGGETSKTNKEKGRMALKAARKAATATEQAFNLEACQCAFVVFNNLESKRRCLRDYRKSDWFFPHRYQPKLLQFRNGKFPLLVQPAPEPSNILWENLEITDRGRFYRRSLTNFVTFLLLLFSCAIISGAQSAQTTFKAKMPPAGLCEWSLPQVFYASDSFYSNSRISWDLAWDQNTTCTPGNNSETRYHIAYTNGIIRDFNFSNPAPLTKDNPAPRRCIDPCVSETSSVTCSTLPCFDQDLIDQGDVCETYLESHILYCFCTNALTTSMAEYGFFNGPQNLWQTYLPCRSFITDYLAKNAFIIVAAGVVVIVNLLLKAILRAFADFERHSSESAKASAIAVKMFSAQFLNTAIIVLIVNSAIGVSKVPLAKDLFKGKYRDFEREWYPTVGMGITMTMLINAFVPQGILFAQMFLISPLLRVLKRRKIRTQDQMNKLYAGPQFDISVRYPMILNSVFVTMVFCGGSPILLFIAAVASAGTFWFDKLSIIHLYSIKTAYDEELGEIALGILPWTLVLHLAFSTWMYGNTKLMQSPTLDLTGALKFFGYTVPPNSTDPNALYDEFMARAAKIDILGQYGFMVKIVHSNVMTMFVFFVIVLVGIFVSTLWLQVFLPILKRTLFLILRAIWKRLEPKLEEFLKRRAATKKKKTKAQKSAKVAVDNAPVVSPSPVVGGEASVDLIAPTMGEILGDEATTAALAPAVDGEVPAESLQAQESTEVPQREPSAETSAPLPASHDSPAPVDAPPVPDMPAIAEGPNDLGLTPTGLGTMQLLVTKSARAPEPLAATIEPIQTTPVPTSPGATAVTSPRVDNVVKRVIPEFTDFFRKTVARRYVPDKKLGFDKNSDGELIRKWREETVINDMKRQEGEPMRTWEAMQAPVKIYAIEANQKYKLAVAELIAASKRMRTASTALSKVVEVHQDHEGGDGHPGTENKDALETKSAAQAVTENLIATEPVTLAGPNTTTAASAPPVGEMSPRAPPGSARIKSPRVDEPQPTIAPAETVDAPDSIVEPATASAALPEAEGDPSAPSTTTDA
ncbi:hypothetical protein Gpo141_00008536 [Globisporangium polare]